MVQLNAKLIQDAAEHNCTCETLNLLQWFGNASSELQGIQISQRESINAEVVSVLSKVRQQQQIVRCPAGALPVKFRAAFTHLHQRQVVANLLHF